MFSFVLLLCHGHYLLSFRLYGSRTNLALFMLIKQQRAD